MVEIESGTQDKTSASENMNEYVVKKKQYDFEKLNYGVVGGDLKEKTKKSFNNYLPWIIVVLVLIILIGLIFIFDIV